MSSIIEQRLPNRPSVASSPDTTAPLLAVSNVSKSFPGVVALSGVDLALRGGEIHALLGENGAGKSTLIRVITGAQYPDEGELVIEGRSVQIASPRVARQFGIGVVPQEVLFVPGLSIGRNMLLGFDKPLVRRSHLSETEHAVVSKALDQVGARFAPTAIASTLSVPDLRLAQIARTLIQPGNIIILDEPTAVLSEPDAERLLEKLLSLRDLGKGIIYITHRLSEVMKIADRATVLRDGRCVALFDRPEFDRAKMVEAMARLDKDSEQARERAVDARRDANEAREVMLNVQGLSLIGRFHNVSFTARAGEVVGIAGVQGSGHGHLVRALSGLISWDKGCVDVGNVRAKPGRVESTFRGGLALIPADRRRSAIVTQLSIQENLALGRNVRSICRRFGLRWPLRERMMADELVTELSIHPKNVSIKAGLLSGGNQQKVALARVVEGDSKVVVLEEPTQGVDIRSKAEIHELIKRLAAAEGRAVVVASSEFEELLHLADTIHVMCLGRFVASFRRDDATYHAILHAALP